MATYYDSLTPDQRKAVQLALQAEGHNLDYRDRKGNLVTGEAAADTNFGRKTLDALNKAGGETFIRQILSGQGAALTGPAGDQTVMNVTANGDGSYTVDNIHGVKGTIDTPSGKNPPTYDKNPPPEVPFDPVPEAGEPSITAGGALRGSTLDGKGAGGAEGTVTYRSESGKRIRLEANGHIVDSDLIELRAPQDPRRTATTQQATLGNDAGGEIYGDAELFISEDSRTAISAGAQGISRDHLVDNKGGIIGTGSVLVERRSPDGNNAVGVGVAYNTEAGVGGVAAFRGQVENDTYRVGAKGAVAVYTGGEYSGTLQAGGKWVVGNDGKTAYVLSADLRGGAEKLDDIKQNTAQATLGYTTVKRADNGKTYANFGAYVRGAYNDQESGRTGVSAESNMVEASLQFRTKNNPDLAFGAAGRRIEVTQTGRNKSETYQIVGTLRKDNLFGNPNAFLDGEAGYDTQTQSFVGGLKVGITETVAQVNAGTPDITKAIFTGRAEPLTSQQAQAYVAGKKFAPGTFDLAENALASGTTVGQRGGFMGIGGEKVSGLNTNNRNNNDYINRQTKEMDKATGGRYSSVIVPQNLATLRAAAEGAGLTAGRGQDVYGGQNVSNSGQQIAAASSAANRQTTTLSYTKNGTNREFDLSDRETSFLQGLSGDSTIKLTNPENLKKLPTWKQAAIQKGVTLHGLDIGAIDGDVGSRTDRGLEAIADYENSLRGGVKDRTTLDKAIATSIAEKATQAKELSQQTGTSNVYVYCDTKIDSRGNITIATNKVDTTGTYIDTGRDTTTLTSREILDTVDREVENTTGRRTTTTPGTIPVTPPPPNPNPKPDTPPGRNPDPDPETPPGGDPDPETPAGGDPGDDGDPSYTNPGEPEVPIRPTFGPDTSQVRPTPLVRPPEEVAKELGLVASTKTPEADKPNPNVGNYKDPDQKGKGSELA